MPVGRAAYGYVHLGLPMYSYINASVNVLPHCVLSQSLITRKIKSRATETRVLKPAQVLGSIKAVYSQFQMEKEHQHAPPVREEHYENS